MHRQTLSLLRAAARWVAPVLLALAVTASAQAGGKTCKGVTLPDALTLGELTLVRNGMGLRQATVFNVDVYVAGLYTTQRTKSVARILKRSEAKVIMLEFVRDVDRDEMMDALDEALKDNAGNRYKAARKHLVGFAKLLPKLKKGTVLSLAYVPGQGLSVSAGGKVRGVERDDEFANLVFRSWLGDHPPDKGLKAGLLGGRCG